MPRTGVVFAGVGAVMVAGFAWALSLAMDRLSYSVWGTMIAAPVIVAVNVVLLATVLRRVESPRIARIIMWGFALKMLGSTARYLLLYQFYDGVGDAARYSRYATEHYHLWREGVFGQDLTPLTEGHWGTGIMELLVTAVYTITGPSMIAGFFVFASLAFWGCFLLYRAFATAIPDGNLTRYAALVFLLPSFLYWPSGIGKEAWMLFGIGITALGAARLYRHRAGAYPLILLGSLATVIIRPHFTAMLIAAIVAAQVFRPGNGSPTAIIPKAISVGLLAYAAIIVTGQTAEFLGIDTVSADAVSNAVTTAGANTEQGGSQFTPIPVTSPLVFPASAMTVLFRPFPWEAGNVQMLIASAEAVFVLGLLASSWRGLVALPRHLVRQPYVIFALTYTLLFIYAFSVFGNFGILVRERVLVLPFVLVLTALPVLAARAPDHAEDPARVAA